MTLRKHIENRIRSNNRKSRENRLSAITKTKKKRSISKNEIFSSGLGKLSKKKLRETVEKQVNSSKDTLGQGRKGLRRMPRHTQAKKDAASGETQRGAAGTHRTADIRMGEPVRA